MDLDIYNAAAKGKIEIFKERFVHYQLNSLVTPRNNTILHINITAQTREKEKDESTQFIQQILDLCPSLLLQANTKGETLLHIAARHGLVATVKALLQCAKNSHHDCNNHEIESGLDIATQMVRTITTSKDTALHEAVRHHHTGVVQILIREDPDFPYSANEAGETPLYLAAERGYHDVVSKILETCMSIAHGGPNGRTSLHAAAIFNDEGNYPSFFTFIECIT